MVSVTSASLVLKINYHKKSAIAPNPQCYERISFTVALAALSFMNPHHMMARYWLLYSPGKSRLNCRRWANTCDINISDNKWKENKS
mmetsp:Transcript_13425/g.23576  ORF Transcript_13425/g.23576 Transcript_13425/m.23576 type:complete len:87 (+) Transcript_13425:80-340(+)